jgi:hypothetical protein
MSLYKKFTNYLLTHQPLLWHSMSIQLTLVVALLNLLFYYIGYAAVDLRLLKENYNISGYFYKETFALLWVISGLVIFVVWGAFFYRHNAAKNFYPMSKWYFHKMAFLLFIPLLIFFWTPFTFQKGVMSKTKSLVDKQSIDDLQKTYVEAFPFLLNSSGDYAYQQRNFPEEYIGIEYFNLEDEDNYYVQYFFEDKQQKLSKILKKIEAKPIYERIYAYRTNLEEQIEIRKGDTCLIHIEVFDRALDSIELEDFVVSNVKNFNYDNFLNYMMFYDAGKAYNLGEFSNEFTEELQIKLHKRIQQESTEILDLLKSFKVLLEHYEITNTLDPEKNFNYLIKNNFNYTRELTSSIYSDDYYYSDYETAPYDAAYEEDADFDDPNLYQDEDYYVQLLNTDGLENLLNNVTTAHTSNYFYNNEEFYGLLYFALALTMLFLYFEWGHVLSFVISIPVSGGITLIGVLINVFAHQVFHNISPNSYYWLQAFAPFTMLLFMALVLFIAYRGVKASWNVFVTNIAVSISYFMFPLWIAVGAVFINLITVKYYYDPCMEYLNTKYLFDLNSYYWQYTMKWSPFVLYFISIFAIKKILSKKE